MKQNRRENPFRLCLPLLGILLLSAGCSRERPTTSLPDASVQVHLLFESQAPPPGSTAAVAGSARTPGLERLQVSLFELVLPDSTELLRVREAVDLAPEDSTYRVTLRVPPALLYRLRVEVSGQRISGEGATERGLLYTGDALLGDVRAGSSRSVEVRLPEVVPSLSLSLPSPSAFRLSWSEVAGARSYRLKQRRPEGTLFHRTLGLDTLISFLPPVPGPSGTTASAPAAFLESWRVRAELSDSLASAYSESVLVGVPEPPADVTDLRTGAASDSSILLLWTAPGNDGLEGQAHVYDLRIDTVPITDAGWESARRIEGLPAPAPSGTGEHFTVEGLQDHSEYFLALKTGSEIPLWSGPSNIVAARTLLAPPRTLEALPTAPDLISLNWVYTGHAEEGFLLLRQGPGGGFLPVGPPLAPSARTYVDSGLEPLTRYTYRLVAFAGTDTSAIVEASATTPDRPPVCRLFPESIGFPTVRVGTAVDSAFTISNLGGGTLAGRIDSASCPAFQVLAGGGNFALSQGESRTVDIRFEPIEAGTQECRIPLGTSLCPEFACSGIGEEPPPLCQLSRTSIPFDTLLIGETADLSFTVRNAGGGNLEGEAGLAEGCGAFSLPGASGAFHLAAGESLEIAVRFAPSAPGVQTCSVQLGTGLCPPVECTGVGFEPPPLCQVSPTFLLFDSLLVEDAAEDSFVVRNAGGGILDGELSLGEECSDFSLPGASGSFRLAAGDSIEVVVRFQPSAPGERTCSVQLGTIACPAVECSGSGYEPPVCAVSRTGIDYVLQVGTEADSTFLVANTGGGTLSGIVQLVSGAPDYRIVSGAGPFSLGPGEQREIAVGFRPLADGGYSGHVDLGTGCPGVDLTGSASYENRWQDGFGNAVRDSLFAMVPYENGLAIGGRLTQAGSIPVDNVAFWDGKSWGPLGYGIPDAVGGVRAMAMFRGQLIAGGDFVLGQVYYGLARLLRDTYWYPVGNGLLRFDNGRPAVHALTVYAYPDTMLIVGGRFDASGYEDLAPNVVGWDGEQWIPLGGGLNGTVYALCEYQGFLIAGGRFSIPEGPEICVAAWNGARWFPMGDGIPAGSSRTVYALAVSGGTLFAGGRLDLGGASGSSCVAAWDGTAWRAAGDRIVPGEVRALALYAGDLVAAGSFGQSGTGYLLRNIARLRNGLWLPMASGLDGAGRCLLPGPCDLFAGGRFATAGGKPSLSIGLWSDCR